MSETLIERMARAIAAEFHDWESLTAGEQREYHSVALAALRAIREPTEAMLNAAFLADLPDESYDATGYDHDHWQVMIDAAIAEAGGQE